MSGIVGIYRTDGQAVTVHEIEQMLAGIVHRGNDAKHIWTDRAVGLGHRMHWTTPEAVNERQPLVSEDGQLVLVADARVDNRVELRDALSGSGMRLRTDTDAELILRSYQAWGEACPARIIGDFAFAIWDGQEGKLFCVRDPIGIKPFFYHFDGRTFTWASSPQGFFETGRISRQPNLGMMSRMLLNRFHDREETLHQGICRIPPAHAIVVERGQLRKTCYWQIDPEHSVRYRTDDEYAEHFLELFRTSVRARLRSYGRPASMLSGGLDSSSIACVAQQLLREQDVADPLQVYSAVFDEWPCDESEFIDAVAEKWEMASHRFRHQEHLKWLDFELMANYPDAFYSPTILMFAPAFEHARQNNIRVLFSGNGGDELLASSLVHLADFARQGRFATLFRQLKHDAEYTSASKWSLVRDFCIRPLVPKPIRRGLRWMRRTTAGETYASWLTPECIQKADSSSYQQRTAPQTFRTAAQKRICSALVEARNLTVALGRLEAFASHFGIEHRYPFFDRRMVEFMVAVPEEQRWFGPCRKTILRRAMVNILPEKVRLRNSKVNFNRVLERAYNGHQLEKTETILANSTLAEFGLIDRKEFMRVFESSAKRDVVPGEIRRTVHNVMVLELWCRTAL